MTWRRYSEYRGRRLRPDEVLLERFAMSPLGLRFLRDVAPAIDKRLIPRSGGRLSTTGIDKVGILTAIGARSGQRRTQPVVMVPEGEGLLVIGSNYGRPAHPAWAHNLLAHPECEVTFGGESGPYVATLLTGEERAAAWNLAVDYYNGYATYARTCAPREIRVFRLTPGR